jgi:hypothetical protein
VLLVGELLSKGSNIGTDLMSLEKRLREAYEDLKMLKEEFNSYYTKTQIDSEFYTKTELDDRPYVLETGSNANGFWRKWSDGMLECWGTKSLGNVNVNTAQGGVYYGSTPYNITWPAVFTSLETCLIWMQNSGGGATWISTATNAAPTTTSPNFYIFRPTSVTVTGVVVSFMAIGRWQA